MKGIGVRIGAILVLCIIVGALYVQFKQSSSTSVVSSSDVTTATTTATTTTAEQTTLSTETTTQTMKATLKTNKGTIVLELYADKTPNTVNNFVTLANSGFYTNTKFHRVIEGFMIQGGDPLTKDDTKQAQWGTGGPDYRFADEFVPELSNVTGTISMANAGPNTNGSQFFINVADNTFLDGKHSVFGRVVEGMDVVMAISQVDRSSRDVPLEPVIVESITISE